MEIEEKHEVIKSSHKIKAKGVFDLADFYMDCYLWFTHYNYNIRELKYRYVENPDGSFLTEVWWECTKQIDSYISFLIEWQWQAIYTNVEVNIDGKKRGMNKGSVELRGGAFLKKNVQAWKGKLLGPYLGKIYEILISKKLDRYEDELWLEAHKFYSEVRAALGIK